MAHTENSILRATSRGPTTLEVVTTSNVVQSIRVEAMHPEARLKRKGSQMRETTTLEHNSLQTKSSLPLQVTTVARKEEEAEEATDVAVLVEDIEVLTEITIKDLQKATKLMVITILTIDHHTKIITRDSQSKSTSPMTMRKRPQLKMIVKTSLQSSSTTLRQR